MDKKTSSPTLLKKISSRALSDKKPLQAAPSKKQEIKISEEQIAFRAYFISERRRELGWGGDEQTDWIDAEKQLLAEAQGK